MFSQIGWPEILVFLLIGLIVIGPERLPGLVKDFRAVVLAFRNLVADARKQLDDDLGPEFDEFRKPLQELNNVRQMGARGFITKTLFDDDDSFLTSLDQTGKDIRGSVDSVRESAIGRGPRPATDQQAPADDRPCGEQPSGIEVQQQADAGESRTEPAPGRASDSQPPTKPMNPWDDVL